ncbi:hypothetical protein MRX96_000060 [Rhipicephalus microplus]
MPVVGKLDPFDPSTSEWAEYRERAELYFIANDIPSDKKTALLTMLASAPLQRSSNGRLSPTFEGRFQLERHGEVLFVVPCVTGACCSGRTANASAVFFFGLESCLAVPRV